MILGPSSQQVTLRGMVFHSADDVLSTAFITHWKRLLNQFSSLSPADLTISLSFWPASPIFLSFVEILGVLDVII